MKTDVLIVGGGLSGLSVADRLSRTGGDFVLIEAQNRWGGRILSRKYQEQVFDLGPAWFWPGQPRMAVLAERFGLKVFDQFSDGSGLFQSADGSFQKAPGIGSMKGSLRLSGGLSGLSEALKRDLPQDRLHLDTPLVSLSLGDDGVLATVGKAETPIAAKVVVLALPPRVVDHSIRFHPHLPELTRQSLRAIPTWMAGHAKFLALYDTPWWRRAGCSGDVISQAGPLVEIHDASPARNGPYALFGFVGVPCEVRAQHASVLPELALKQLATLFGEPMLSPLNTHLQDWSRLSAIATAEDFDPPHAHPNYGTPLGLTGPWGDRLVFASTEMAREFGGFLEGALEAADQATKSLA